MYRRIPADLVPDVSDLEWCELFHCTPSQLDGEDYHRLQRLGTIHAALEKWRAAEAHSGKR